MRASARRAPISSREHRSISQTAACATPICAARGCSGRDWAAPICGASLARARLDGARLRGTKLDGAPLTYADLTGADLRYAQLQGSDLADAVVDGADLVGTNVWRARFDATAGLPSAVRRSLERNPMLPENARRMLADACRTIRADRFGKIRGNLVRLARETLDEIPRPPAVSGSPAPTRRTPGRPCRRCRPRIAARTPTPRSPTRSRACSRASPARIPGGSRAWSDGCATTGRAGADPE